MAVEPRRRRRRDTVRARTTVAATLIVGLALAIGGVAVVSIVHRSLVHNVDKVAELLAEDIASLARQGILPSTLISEEDAVVQVVDDESRVVAASINVLGDPPIGTLHPVGDQPVSRTVQDLPGLKGPFRLLALRATSPDGPATVYIATNLEPAERTVFLLRASMLVGAPLLLALVAVMTWLTVGRALRPVEAIRSQVAEVSGRDLHRRVPVPASDDEISRLAGTMNAMLERLETVVEKQQRFVADASHELQTPLAASRVDLEVALAHPQATSWHETARALLEENRRMERLVSDLLFIARADGAAPPAPTSPVDLHEIILEEAARIGGSSRIRVDTSGVAGAFVLGHRGELVRAFRNLLDNARRHAATGVTIGLHEVGGTVTLVIEDDGLGIPMEDRERIFERFTRLDGARGRRTGGAGLGLAIVKDIVERHHGSVTVEDHPAGGARFVIELPSD